MTDQAVDTTGAQIPAAAVPSATPDVSRLPCPPPPGEHLVGRVRELRELRADIARAGLDTLAGRKAPRARVLLVAGRPGSGRTALARGLAARVAADYPDGVLSVRLTAPDGSALSTGRAARLLLARLGGTPAPGADDEDLTAELRTALHGRRAVLLLDDGVTAEQVEELLPDTPDCLAIVVSQGPLPGLRDVRPCVLSGLEPEAGKALLASYTGTVRLTNDPRAAEALVRECRGLPAALALAGGRLAAQPRLSVLELVRQLRAEGEGDVLDRMFRLVHDGLPASWSRALRMLRLAPAGLADAHTVSALTGRDPAEGAALLQEFAAAGLLRPTAGEHTQYEVPLCLSGLLREFSEDRDRPAEVALARARVLERTARQLLACRAAAEPEGSWSRKQSARLPQAQRFPSAEAARRWLDARRPALLDAVAVAEADPELAGLARRLVSSLVHALVLHHGTAPEAAELYGLHRSALALAERRGDQGERAGALLNLADLDRRADRTARALERYRQALDAARAARDPELASRATESLGSTHDQLGDPDRAADWYGRALAHAQTRRDHAEEARLTGRVAAALAAAGDPAGALTHWKAAVAVHRRSGDLTGQARALAGAAEVHAGSGRAQEALRICQEAAELARRAGAAGLRAALQLQLAVLLEELGDPAAARLHREAARRITDESGDRARPVTADGDLQPVAADGPVGDGGGHGGTGQRENGPGDSTEQAGPVTPDENRA